MGSGRNNRSRIQQKNRNQALRSFIEDGDSMKIIAEAEVGSPELQTYLALAGEIQPRIRELKDFFGPALNAIGKDSLAHSAICRLKERYELSCRGRKADHRERRALVSSLGLRKGPYSASDLFSGQITLPGIKVVQRERQILEPGQPGYIGLKSVMSDTDCRPGAGDTVISESEGFYVVAPDESVIFVSQSDGVTTVELAVIRGTAYSAACSENLYDWATGVVRTACCERRDVRPHHDGHMAQIGWNAGPQHARVWGLAKSYTKKLDDTTRIEHDRDAIALLTLCWSLSRAYLPTEVILPIEKALADSGMPRIATRDVSEGTGYRLVLEGKVYEFPIFERAPPEGYMTRDYVAWVHKDRCFAQYGLSWCVGRTLGRVNSRAHKNSTAEDRNLWPELGGGNFVDVTLRVIVQQAAGTLMAFQPEYPHGTTRLCGAHNQMVTITSSQHIATAFKKAQLGNTVESGAGAGEGDVD